MSVDGRISGEFSGRLRSRCTAESSYWYAVNCTARQNAVYWRSHKSRKVTNKGRRQECRRSGGGNKTLDEVMEW